jgi:hypothetical protein
MENNAIELKTKKIFRISLILFILFSIIITYALLAKLQHWTISPWVLRIGIMGMIISYIVGGYGLYGFVKNKMKEE